MIAYQFNGQALPSETHDPEFDTGVLSFMNAVLNTLGPITHEVYDSLPLGHKKFWVAIEIDDE